MILSLMAALNSDWFSYALSTKINLLLLVLILSCIIVIFVFFDRGWGVILLLQVLMLSSTIARSYRGRLKFFIPIFLSIAPIDIPATNLCHNGRAVETAVVNAFNLWFLAEYGLDLRLTRCFKWRDHAIAPLYSLSVNTTWSTLDPLFNAYFRNSASSTWNIKIITPALFNHTLG